MVFFCYCIPFLQHLFPTLLDVVGNLGNEDVANLLFVATECHVALDEFLAGAAVVGVVEDVGGIAASGLLVGFPNEELVEHHLGTRHLLEHTALKQCAGQQLARSALLLFEGTYIGELRQAHIGYRRLLVGALAVEGYGGVS